MCEPVSTSLLIGSMLAGTGAQMYTAQKGRRQQSNLAQRQEQLARQERIRQTQLADSRERQLSAANNLQRGQVMQAENAQLQTKGIAPLGEQISSAVLDSRYT